MNSRRTVLKAAIAGVAAGLSPTFIRDLRAEEVIKVAGIHDASGGLEFYGKQQIAALDLAVKEQNAAGGLLGKRIELTAYDAQSSTQLYTQFATEASAGGDVSVVVGGLSSSAREAIRPILRRYKTLYMYNTYNEGGVCDRNYFNTGSTPGQTIYRLIPYVMSKWNAKSAYILAADYNFGQIMGKWFTKYVRDGGGSIVGAEYFPLDVTDFGATIQKIQAAKPDMVLLCLVGGNHMAFYRQWAASGMHGRIPLASGDLDHEIQVLSPAEGDGIHVAYSYLDGLANPQNKAFKEKMNSQYGVSLITEMGAQTYTGFNLWAGAVKKAGSVDRMKVIAALEDNASFVGPAGKTTIDPKTHQAISDIYIGESKGGRFVELASFPQQMPTDTAEVCDLKKFPEETKQFVIDVKS
jgi:urea transport system substrate-binding protein